MTINYTFISTYYFVLLFKFEKLEKTFTLHSTYHVGQILTI